MEYFVQLQINLNNLDRACRGRMEMALTNEKRPGAEAAEPLGG